MIFKYGGRLLAGGLGLAGCAGAINNSRKSAPAQPQAVAAPAPAPVPIPVPQATPLPAPSPAPLPIAISQPAPMFPQSPGTPCGRLICDNSGPRPKYLGQELNLPDILVFNVPQEGRYDQRFQVVPSYLTDDPRKTGKTRHHQAIDIMNESHKKLTNWLVKNGLPKEENKITTDLDDFISAGSVQGGEPKTQSCTVNASEGNKNAGEEGQMVEEQREEFLAVWAYMVETGQDKVLKETIEKKQPRSIVVFMEHNGFRQEWGITVLGLHDYY